MDYSRDPEMWDISASYCQDITVLHGSKNVSKIQLLLLWKFVQLEKANMMYHPVSQHIQANEWAGCSNTEKIFPSY